MQSKLEMIADLACSAGPETAGESMWLLLRADAADGKQQIAVSPLPFIVGRRPGSSLQINCRTISGMHAALVVKDSELWVEDLQSTNGTYVNGRKIEKSTRLDEEDLLQFADVVFRVRRSQSVSSCNTMHENVCDSALALVQFDRLMQNRLVCPYFQPIIDMQTSEFVGFEVLGRSKLFGLESCQAMFHAASRLSMEVELSRMLRWEGVRQAMAVPLTFNIFLNTHPLEIRQEGLLDSMITTRQLTEDLPMVLEVHEAAITHPSEMRELKRQLRDINVGLAYDDFGAGQTRLTELIEAPPDYLKFDMSLIRGIDQATPERQKMLASLVRIVTELGINPLAEGVETAEEAEVCKELGFLTAQGFHFGRPAPGQNFQ